MHSAVSPFPYDKQDIHDIRREHSFPLQKPDPLHLHIAILCNGSIQAAKISVYHPFPVCPNPKNESKRIRMQSDLLHLLITFATADHY